MGKRQADEKSCPLFILKLCGRNHGRLSLKVLSTSQAAMRKGTAKTQCCTSVQRFLTLPDDKDVDDIIRNARKQLERHVASAVPCITKREREKKSQGE